MKGTPHIGIVIAALWLGSLAAPGDAAGADASRPTYNNSLLKSPRANDNDYHANYHADYSATQDGRAASPKAVDERPDPREDSRRFQEGDRYPRSPSGWRR